MQLMCPVVFLILVHGLCIRIVISLLSYKPKQRRKNRLDHDEIAPNHGRTGQKKCLRLLVSELLPGAVAGLANK